MKRDGEGMVSGSLVNGVGLLGLVGAVGLAGLAGLLACHPDAAPQAGGVAPPASTAAAPSVLASAPAAASSAPALAAQLPVDPCTPGAVVPAGAITAAVQGSFTAVGADETAGLVACGSGGTGAAVMAVGKHVDGGWQTERTIAWGDSRSSWGACTPLPTRDGRALLVCSRGAAQLGTITRELVALDFALDGDAATQTLVTVRDTTDTACSGARSVLSAALGDPSIADISGDGLDDVRVQVRVARSAIAAQPPCKSPGAVSPGQPAHVPQPPARSLEFVLEGDRLQPTTPTRAELKKIAALGE